MNASQKHRTCSGRQANESDDTHSWLHVSPAHKGEARLNLGESCVQTRPFCVPWFLKWKNKTKIKFRYTRGRWIQSTSKSCSFCFLICPTDVSINNRLIYLENRLINIYTHILLHTSHVEVLNWSIYDVPEFVETQTDIFGTVMFMNAEDWF